MKTELNYKLVGQRIRTIRKKRGMTQERLAELTEISPQHCSGIETGAAKVSLPALVKIANIGTKKLVKRKEFEEYISQKTVI